MFPFRCLHSSNDKNWLIDKSNVFRLTIVQWKKSIKSVRDEHLCCPFFDKVTKKYVRLNFLFFFFCDDNKNSIESSIVVQNIKSNEEKQQITECVRSKKKGRWRVKRNKKPSERQDATRRIKSISNLVIRAYVDSLF